MGTCLTRRVCAVVCLLAVIAAGARPSAAQGLGAGGVQGVVKDPTGGVLQSVEVKLANPVTGFARTVTTDAMGRFAFSNVPPNPYHLSISAEGFQMLDRDVDVRAGVPIALDLTMALAGETQQVQVVGHVEDLLERDPTAHTDIDQSLIDRLPIETAAGLNQVVMKASPGVVADSNGFFHPIGDHAQTQFSLDNQPITDQQSRIYSNQISDEAVQSLEVITGVAPAEYGDKNSLVVHVVTKSGLDLPKPSGNATLGYGSFRSPTGDVSFGGGSHKVGNFVSFSGLQTDRYLDPPEFEALNGEGHSTSFFNRFDFRPTDADTLRLNLQIGQSGFHVPNTYDQIGKDQHQDITTFNIAPAYTRVLSNRSLFTANAFVRHDHLRFDPSTDPFEDTPATVSQDRSLTNNGVKADLSMSLPRHTIKFGGGLSWTKLREQFTFGITDPLDAAFAGEDGNFDSALAAYDLTAGGSPLSYDQSGTIKGQNGYVQDTITAGNATFNLGLRLDHYDGLTSRTLLQPRLGASYSVPGNGTILRASYGRTLETPYNENLLLSAGVGLNGQFGDGQPVPPGERHQVELGVQQALGRWFVADFGYFNKRTTNAYDFAVLFDTPLAFPVAWDHSRINGFTGRVNLVEHNGLSAFVVMAHANAIYSPPGVGGILLEQPEGDFRIDHDQKFNSTTNVQYEFEKRFGAWAALSWRYDSGLVAGAVGSLEDVLGLTADQQAAIGLSCGGVEASLGSPLTAAQCTSDNVSAKRVRIPAEGTADDVDNPPRIAPRHLFDLGVGVDNLLRTDRTKLRLRFSVLNLTNKEALYNFLSTFSGTHFVTPRAYQVQVGMVF
jgi:carboxypeptidase family protein